MQPQQTDLPLAFDGEKISQRDLMTIFQRPPRVPMGFNRSSLVVGSRGSGKTTLLRALKERHIGIAERIDLGNSLSPLFKATAFGPLTYGMPEGTEQLLMGKTKSLVATAIARSLFGRPLTLDLTALNSCLPSTLRLSKSPSDFDAILTLTAEIIRSPLSSFEPVADLPGLRTLVEALGKQAHAQSAPLLIMFDRADMVPTACLVPVLELLDQSPEYVALVAMRPSPSGLAISEFSRRVIAGDHYDVYHLGAHPRSSDWLEFVGAAVQA